MKHFVIFSKEEIDALGRDEKVVDAEHNVIYMSSAAYEKYLKKKEEDSEKW